MDRRGKGSELNLVLEGSFKGLMWSDIVKNSQAKPIKKSRRANENTYESRILTTDCLPSLSSTANRPR